MKLGKEIAEYSDSAKKGRNKDPLRSLQPGYERINPFLVNPLWTEFFFSSFFWT